MEIKNSGTGLKAGLITSVKIDRLFGRYDYNIEIPRLKDGTISRITTMYGENGSGKTTILKILFHLLSPSGNRGHRGFLGRVPFGKFRVTFLSGIIIEVAHEEPNLLGRYSISLSKPGTGEVKGIVDFSSEGRVTSETTSKSAEQIIANLEELGLAIYSLGDDRELISDQFIDTDGEVVEMREGRFIGHRVDLIRPQTTRQRLNWREIELRRSFERTGRWLSQRSIAASTKGELESQHIYANIIETINKIGLPRLETYQLEKGKLIDELSVIGERSASCQRFGLVPRIDAKRFIISLDGTPDEELPFVLQVVRSFVDGQKARLNQIEGLRIQLQRFVELINGFFRDKRIEIDVKDGISIIVDSEEKLEPENLSSGEKQLLLIFCNVLTSSEKASLFLLDEPELSLNVKWQRKLIDSIIDIVGNSECQFILATHSIELLTKHFESNIKLDNKAQKKH